MITSIDHNAITVLSIEKSLDFYVNALGLKNTYVKEREGIPWEIVLAIPENNTVIELFSGGVKDKDNVYAADQIGYHHWSLACTDIDALANMIRSKGYISEGQIPSTQPNGGKSMWIHDPEGNALEIIQHLPVEAYNGKEELLGIDHIGFVTSDIYNSLDFYCNQLYLKHINSVERDGKPWMEVVEVKPGQTIEFFLGGTKNIPNKWESAGFAHISFHTPDVYTVIEKLRKYGSKVIIEPETFPDGRSHGWVTDADGCRIQFMS